MLIEVIYKVSAICSSSQACTPRSPSGFIGSETTFVSRIITRYAARSASTLSPISRLLLPIESNGLVNNFAHLAVTPARRRATLGSLAKAGKPLVKVVALGAPEAGR